MAGILSHISSTFESALEGSQGRMQSVYQNEYVSKGIKGILNSLRNFLQIYFSKNSGFTRTCWVSENETR